MTAIELKQFLNMYSDDELSQIDVFIKEIRFGHITTKMDMIRSNPKNNSFEILYCEL